MTIQVELNPEMESLLTAEAQARGMALESYAQRLLQDAMIARKQVLQTFDEIKEYAATRNPYGYTEADVPRLIREVRAENTLNEGGGKDD